ncbi:E3 ubiquitin-protein ligase RBBP6-like isoform X2 [Hippocampus comes]|uniref:E3 ubiquitin-protein ligase RBBP6-like isoform X2 n=1 Tax=Hippocampus comes TaxID=109280 RepID=UPI00094F0DD0|nr:PREDICTED: E3 ubiquitin-protein ligase RBBP6-like isoform X2 [Hippocampus comes]
MTHIHYKFSSKLSYATVVFDGPHITLTDLKERIMGREKLRAGDCDLQITNAQTKEEYTDEEGLIPKGSSVIVRRVPNIRVSVKKTHNTERSAAHCHFASGAVKAMDDHSSSKTLPLFSKMVNLAAADVSEDDKIKVVMNQSAYDPMTLSSYNKKLGGVLPANYTCFRCGNAGHHIRKCPSAGDKNFDAPPKIKKSTGIPRSFMVEVDDPNIRGAMLTNCGRFAIPAIDAQAYAVGKKEKHPFLHQEESEPEDENIPVPEELQCLICRDLLVDSVVIPCCGNSYCDDCIRTTLLDSEEHICPTCHQSDVSPDTLIANKFLRQAVNNFKKEKGYTKSLKGKSAGPQSLTATATPNPVPTPSATQQKKSHQSTRNQQADVNKSGAHPVSGLQSSVEAPEKTQDDSVAVTPPVFLNKDPTAVQTKPMTMVHNDPVQKTSLGQTPTNMHSSSSSSVCPAAVTSEFQPLPPSSSSVPPAPPPLFFSHHFHSFPPGQQYLSHPPGPPVGLPNWTQTNPQGPSIPPLIPSSSPSIRPLAQREWFSHHGHRRERSPETRSTYRRSSRSKSKSSRSSSRSSRSRSKSHGRSRSPYSRHRVPHSHTNPSRCYSYGYKRSHSPTPSSSSSPRDGSRSTSQSDHRKKRHHSKKSSQNSCKSRRRVEHSPASSRNEKGHSGPCGASEPTSSQETDTDYYQQWKRQYKEWYDKYFSSYVSHYHQLPPPPNPLWADRAEDHSSRTLNSFNHLQYPRSPSTHRHSPPSQSSSDSRSSHSQSSSEGHSPPPRSSSDCSSPLPHSPGDTRSSPSENAAPHWGSTEKDSQEQGATAKSEELPALKPEHERKIKYDKVVPEDHTRSLDAAPATSKKDKRRNHKTCGDSIPDSDALEAVQIPLKPNQKEKERQRKPESENKCERGKDSTSRRQEGERPPKVKPREKAHRGVKDTQPEVDKATKSERKEKGVGEEKKKEKSPIVPPENRHMHPDLEIPEVECPQPVDKEKQQEQKKEEKKPLPPRVKNIWEEGMNVKPQKKISINIKLDGKKPEEKTEKQEWSCSERSDANEDGEKVKVEALHSEKQQATGPHDLCAAEEEDGTKSQNGAERQNLKETEENESARIDDGRKEMRDVKVDERVTNNNGEKERKSSKENGEDERVTKDDRGKERRIGKEIEENDSGTNVERGLEQDKSVAPPVEEKTADEANGAEPPEESKPEEELMVGVKMKTRTDEDADSVMMSSSSENITAEPDNTFIEDHGGGEEPLESRIEGTTSPREEKHGEHDTPELMQVPFFELQNPEETEQEQVSPPTPGMPGHREARGDAEQESQRSVEMQTDDENTERNSCLALSSGQYTSDSGDTEMEGKMGSDRPRDDEREWKGEGEEKESHQAKEDAETELPIPPKIQLRLTSHHADSGAKEQEDDIDASSHLVHHSECKKTINVIPDVKSKSTEEASGHIYEMEGRTGADWPIDYETNWEGEEGKKEKDLPQIQPSLTSHHAEGKYMEQEVSVDASKESHLVDHSDWKKQINVIPDVKSKSTKVDYAHNPQHHNRDNVESKSKHRNSPPPSLVHLSGRLQGPPESSGSTLARKPSDEPPVNSVSNDHREAKPRASPLSKHSDAPAVKARPMSREELWKRYKLEKQLKESQQDRAGREASRHPGRRAEAERVGGEKPSGHDSYSGIVKKSEHERRPKKHKKGKPHGDADPEELERKLKKSKKKHEGSQ